MKASIVLYFLFVCTYSIPTTITSQLDRPWTLFKRTYEKRYPSNREEITRRTIWEDNLDMIHKHNLEADLGLHTYTLGINQFSDMTNEEFNKRMKGLDMSLKDSIKGIEGDMFVAPADFQLPDSVDWRTKGYVTPVKNQKQCGSCWAFSATGALEGQHFAKTQKLVPLSEQELVDCSHKFGNAGCQGGLVQCAFRYISNNSGIDTESSYPYEARGDKCRFNASNVGATENGYTQLPNQDENALQAAIATIGPISVAIDASLRSFQHYRSGVYNDTTCSSYILDHAVLAVGYDSVNGKDYYIVKNSWGAGWGNKGYIWMSRNQRNQCGIASEAVYPLV